MLFTNKPFYIKINYVKNTLVDNSSITAFMMHSNIYISYHDNMCKEIHASLGCFIWVSRVSTTVLWVWQLLVQHGQPV